MSLGPSHLIIFEFLTRKLLAVVGGFGSVVGLWGSGAGFFAGRDFNSRFQLFFWSKTYI